MNRSPVAKITRRDALKTALVAGMAPTVLPGRLFGSDAPSKQITLGFIGMGSQGTHANLRNFLAQSDAKVLAVCDVSRKKTETARQMVNKQYGNSDCKGYSDFRRIIEDRAIDAVVISTPDHWHVPMSLMASETGKDVFC